MTKTQKMKKAARKARWQNVKKWFKKIGLKVWNFIKAVWRLICRVCRAFWNWLKSIDIVGMINLTLLLIIIVFFSFLIRDCICCKKYVVASTNTAAIASVKMSAKSSVNDQRNVVNRPVTAATKVLPVTASSQSNMKPQIKVVGVSKPEIVTVASLPANVLPQQKFNGDVIVDNYPSSPVLSNGVKINGNLFIQNMRKYTLPCDAKINGNLFIRNVEKLSFCGAFKVRGNIYVTRQSSFGPIPQNASVSGQIIL